VVRRYLEEYWRAEEKVQLVLLGLSNQVPVTTLCKLNNISPSQFYEWREQFIARGKEASWAMEAEVSEKWSLKGKYMSLSVHW